MRKINSFIKISYLGIFLLCSSYNSNAADDERVSRLEKEVKEIKAQLSNLEKQVIEKNSAKKPIVFSDGWKFLANWRSLKSNMSYDQVRILLGEPEKIQGGSVAYWDYPNKGRVTFVRDKIQSWEEPVDLIK